MTEHQIASAILNYVTSNQGVTNSPIRLEQIRDEVDTLRIRLIAEAEKTLQLVKPYQGYGQHIKNITVQTGEERKRFITVPRIYIDVKGKPAIGYIGGNDGRSPYRIVTGNHQNYIKDDHFLANYPTAIYSEGEITFKNIVPDRIMIRDTIFEDPSALEKWDYDFQETQYPIPNGMIDMIIGKTSDSYIRTQYRIPPQSNTQSDIPRS